MSDRTVLLADDHPPTRAGVRSALEGNGFSIAAEVGDAKAALKAALEFKPDICLLDIHMPGNGIAAAAAISQELPETSIVMLTVSRDDADLFDALRIGASGYLLKDIDPAYLPIALNKVLEGEVALPNSLLVRLVDEFRGRGVRRSIPRRKGSELTSREWEVLDLLREGLQTHEIAERLFISDVTIRTHISAILKKLKVPDRESAIRLLAEDD